MGDKAKTLFKRIEEKMEMQTGQRYSETITIIRKFFMCFDMLKTTVIALIGYRGKPSASGSSVDCDHNGRPPIGSGQHQNLQV